VDIDYLFSIKYKLDLSMI